MRLPPYLAEAVQEEIGQIEGRRLAQAAAQISQCYQAGDFSSSAIMNSAQRAAYLAVRLPAIYAVNQRIFSEVRSLSPQSEIASVLDLGAGPGTAFFAAAEIFPELQHATLLEADDGWISLGKKLAAHSSLAAVRGAQWIKHDLRSGFSCDGHDLAVISYALGELNTAAAEAVVRKAWSCARQFLVVIEPGTPRNFAGINAARSLLIANGAEILAPCPHKHLCPMAARGDWCHFAQRIERTSQHRQLKGGALGYEDEKFSYLVASRTPSATQLPRILRHPGKHSGHVQLELCMPDGQMEHRTITRSQKQAYRLARKAAWGDVWKNDREKGASEKE
ncbi:MAG TPA: small ribosomal subunit Rsm22 family protein [Candidatus Angelobacter sp.]|nr:small ribosomal subunit Rsm22 family protein [Candidatus Angelobacter sp.]